MNGTSSNGETVRLTAYSKGSGCGCKIAPAVLQQVLRSEGEFPPHPDLIVGNETSDDAAVVRWADDRWLISTTDFFMPVVDDPFDFGRIAASNALSDVYAMGGTPVLALAILGWPTDKLSPEIAARVLDGGRFMCRMAGIPLGGGHTIESPEPFFGLAVTGSVLPTHLKKNSTAQEGDLLFLTKPLGVGIISAATKRGVAAAAHTADAAAYMVALNKVGEALGRLDGVHAMTDVTGFGLAGHLLEMCRGSGLGAVLHTGALPVIPGVEEYIGQFIYPDMTMKTFSSLSSEMDQPSAHDLLLLCDPQTSGGLLVAVDPGAEKDYLEVVRAFGLGGIADRSIGRMVARSEKTIQIAP